MDKSEHNEEVTKEAYMATLREANRRFDPAIIEEVRKRVDGPKDIESLMDVYKEDRERHYRGEITWSKLLETTRGLLLLALEGKNHE